MLQACRGQDENLLAIVMFRDLRTRKISGATQPAYRPDVRAAGDCKSQQHMTLLKVKVLVSFGCVRLKAFCPWSVVVLW
jgi:hypothetical protein